MDIQVESGGGSGAKSDGDVTGWQIPLTRVKPSGQRRASIVRRSEIDPMTALVASRLDDSVSSPSD
jgi:hypothetical protein